MSDSMSKDSLKLMRKHLGSIDLSEVEDEKPMSESERRDYVAAIHAVYPRLEADVKRFLYRQLLHTGKEAATWEQVIFGRGSFDGMAQLLAHWKLADDEMRNGGEEEFDGNKPLQ